METRPLVNISRDGYSDLAVPDSYARRGKRHTGIYAMHWDGTYRDRILSSLGHGVPVFTTAGETSIGPISTFAKHLA